MKKSNVLLENLKNKCDFKVIIEDYDFGIFEYSEKDECYHQKETGWYILSIDNIKRAIVDDNYFIKVEMEYK